jgi:hypothetical protein
MAKVAFTADDGGDSDDMIGIGGVAHAEEESQGEDRGQAYAGALQKEEGEVLGCHLDPVRSGNYSIAELSESRLGRPGANGYLSPVLSAAVFGKLLSDKQ